MKSISIVFALLCLVINASGQPPADSLYQAACDLPDTLAIKTRIDAFKQVIKFDSDHAPAHNQLALLYMQHQTPEARQDAMRAVVRAIKCDPQNVTYEITLGRLLREQSAFIAAEKQFQRTLKKYPHSAEAHYWMGSDLLEEFLAVKAEVILGAQVFAQEDVQRAETHLKRSIELDPTHRNAAFRLGLLYLETSRPDSLIHTMLRLLKRNPHDKHALLYCALGYRSIGDWQKAERLYQATLERMDDHERAVMADIEHILTETERRILLPKNETPETQLERERFWRKQDPLILTENNERLLEHYSRVAYAGLRFSLPERNIQGWDTDMGKTHIRFGPALQRVRTRPKPVPLSADPRDAEQMASPLYNGLSERKREVEQFFAQHGLPNLGYTDRAVLPGRETWYYENYNVMFESYIPRGKWEFGGKVLEEIYQDMKNGLPADPAGREVFAEQPPRFIDPYKQLKYQPPHQIVAFRDGNRTRIELACALPKDRLDVQSNAVSLVDGLFLFDPNWDAVQKNVRDITQLIPLGADSLRSAYLMSQRTLRVQPGDYTLISEIMDRNTKTIGAVRSAQTFTIPDTGLAVSDLLLASHITPRRAFPESRHDLHIIPNPLRTYTHTEPVYLYLEVYNLNRNEFGRTRYDITYRVSLPKRDAIDPGLFTPLDAKGDTVEVHTLIDRDDETDSPPIIQVLYRLPKHNQIREILRQMRDIPDRIETAVSAEYEGDRADDFTFLEIDINQLQSGIYTLTVTATDRQTDARMQKETLFRIIK